MNDRSQPSLASLAAALAAATVLGVLGSATIADAKQPGTSAQRRACEPDVCRLCGAYIPFAGPITNCLKRNKRKLNPCRAAFEGRL